MLNENESPYLLIADDLDRQISMDARISNHKHKRMKGSIRELELMAANLRRNGDSRGADEIEADIMRLLDKKICRKIITRSRKEQKLLYMGIV